MELIWFGLLGTQFFQKHFNILQRYLWTWTALCMSAYLIGDLCFPDFGTLLFPLVYMPPQAQICMLV